MSGMLLDRRSVMQRASVLVVSDSFTDTTNTLLQSHTGELGATWTRHTSSAANNLAISSGGRCRAAFDSVTIIYYASGNPVTAEYDVQATFRPMTLVSGEAGGIAGRMSIAANTMYGARYIVASTQWQLFKVVGGTLTSLGLASATLTAATDYVVKLQIRNAAKKLFVDGVEILSSTDNAITSTGQAGFRVFTVGNGDTTGMHFDNFTAL